MLYPPYTLNISHTHDHGKQMYIKTNIYFFTETILVIGKIKQTKSFNLNQYTLGILVTDK